MIEFTLVVPCYNEAKSIPQLLQRASAFVQRPECELLLVDNGSSDSTVEVLTALLPQFPFARAVRIENNQGYGFGILHGLRHAQGRFLGWSHADLQTDPLDALKAFDIIRTHAHSDSVYVKGQRFGRAFADVAFTVGMSIFETCLLRKCFWDINAQPNVFPKSFFDKWQNPPHDFSLDLYAYLMARKQNLKMIRFPVEFRKRQHGHSHWNVDWRSKYKFIRRTVLFSLDLARQPQ